MTMFRSRLGAWLARRVRPAAETRACPPAAGFVELHPLTEPDWRLTSPGAVAREGFAGNPVGYRCVTMIAGAVAALPWLAYDGARELPDHPVLALLARPNPLQGGGELIEAFLGHLLIAGRAYMKVTLQAGAPVELHVLPAQHVRELHDADGWPVAWEYAAGGRVLRFRQRPDEPLPPVMSMRLFSPFSITDGLSPFAPAARAVDIHNAASAWSKALLDNAARPSGALVWRGEAAGGLSAEQLERLRAELVEAFSGPRNAGRPMVLEGGLEWLPLAHSPRDLEHVELRHAAARDIALAFGVPPMLLGIPGDNTYANFAEANRAFWRQTVLPLAARLAGALGNWLAPAWGGGLRLDHDTDAVEALAAERESLWRRLRMADFLTRAEKREAAGYSPDSAGDDRRCG